MVFLRFTTRSQVIGSTVHYPSFLTLTNSNALESVLADVPFFAVGLLGFGVFTFFFVMRRVNRLTIFAHLAVLLAFISAILDLSQILERGVHNADTGANLNQVAPLIILRELGYAVSVGLRLFFFWSFAAEPPRGELPLLPFPDERRPNFITPNSNKTLHSGSWKRWGIIGIIMKWSLLLVIIAIPILQAIWRLAVGFMNFGPVYNTEATLEIVVAALLILKLLANIWLSPLMPRWRTFRDYSPIIFALLINVGLGVGNVLCFEFSESAFGRFISAVDFYVIILYILISSFYKMPVRPSVIADLVRRRLEASPFEGLPAQEAGSSFRVTPPTVSSPDITQAQNILQSSRRPSLLTRISKLSTTSRVSTWLNNRSGSNRQDDQRDRLWALGQAERGEVTLERKSTVDSTEAASMGQRQSVGWTDPTLNIVALKERDSQEVLRAPYALSPTPSPGRRYSRTMDPVIARFDAAEQLPSFYVTPAKRSSEFGGERGSTNSVGTGDSPIYGLNGIIPKSRPMDPLDTTRFTEETRLRVSAADSLLRQQEELDRSIADLRLFSPGYSMDQTSKPTTDTMKTESLRSDFSLSNFPDPPMFIRSESNSALPSPTVPTEAQRKDSDATDTFLELLAPRMLNTESGSTRVPSLPLTTRGSDPSLLGTRAVRLDSQGTQYDVTSFIGDLSTPGLVRGRENSLSQLNEVPGDEETPNPEFGARRNPQGPPARFVRPSPLGISQPQVPLASIPDPASPTDASASVQQSNIPTSFVPRFATSSQRTDRQRRGLQLPAHPRLKISNPIQNSTDVLGVLQAFERPRPPPLVLKNSAKDDAATAARRF